MYIYIYFTQTYKILHFGIHLLLIYVILQCVQINTSDYIALSKDIVRQINDFLKIKNPPFYILRKVCNHLFKPLFELQICFDFLINKR